jgi:hypothetical protein
MTTPLVKSELEWEISCLAYEIDEMKAELASMKSICRMRILTARIEARQQKHAALVAQYIRGEYEDDYEDDRAADVEEMARARGAIDACYDI